jgi:YgiT-type zinc finger domain-containing protein
MKTDHSVPPSADLCTQCHEGTYQNMTKDYTVELRDGDQCTIANLAQRKCNQCGHVVLPWPSVQRVDRAVDDHTEPVTAEFLMIARSQLQPNMTLLAESLGLGSKTWMRWENGEQKMSRSMGYFVRAMEQFPEVYEWVADRGWRRSRDAESLLEIAENIKEVASEYETSIYQFNRRRSGIQPELKQNDEENILDSCS